MRRTDWIWAAGVVGPAVALYLAAGVTGGFLAAEDFQWLTTARDQPPDHLFAFAGHFYRPVVRLWFAGAVRVCGDSTACYHLLNVAIHAVNGLLLFAVTKALTPRPAVAALATASFLVAPGYVETVVWIACLPELLATALFLTTALLVLQVWNRPNAARWWIAAATAMLAVFAHESAVTVLAVLPLVGWITRRHLPENLRRVAVPFLLAVLIFLTTAIVSNRSNPVFTESHYRPGAHMIIHALDYMVSMYVGPHIWPAYVFAVLSVGAIITAGPTLARAGVIWMLLTMVPYLGFTWGNVSRYQYLPTIGFAWIVAGLIAALHDRLAVRWATPARVGVSLLSAFIIVRFAIFTAKGVKERLDWMEAYRTYAHAISRDSRPADGVTLLVPTPQDPRVEADYIQPMLRWTLHAPALEVRVGR
ncbi:MAG: hypothetical protein LC804_24760 [Acidobacteria bacterium]|nr:hypothetical protein [Acidobacteriota bacterium]